MIILDDNEKVDGLEPIDDKDENQEESENTDNYDDVNDAENLEDEEYDNDSDDDEEEENSVNDQIIIQPRASLLNSYNDMSESFPKWDLMPPAVPIKRVRRK